MTNLFQLRPEYAEFLKLHFSGRHVQVLGGAGQVGGFLTKILDDSGAETLVRDISNKRNRFDILRNAGDLAGSLGVHDTTHVFNLAAKVTGVGYNETHQFEMAIQNLLLQAIPLWACMDRNIRFVQVSTACVLPHDAPVPTAELDIMDIFGKPEPSNYGYGIAKQVGELLVRLAADDQPNISAIVVRPWNLYGREQPDPLNGHVIPQLAWHLIKKSQTIQMRAVPAIRRSFTHAWDCAVSIAILGAMDCRGTVNVGSKTDVSLGELVKIMIDVSGYSPAVQWGSLDRGGYVCRGPLLQTLDRLMGAAGLPKWKPQVDFRDGLTEYIEWCRKRLL